MIPKRVRCPQCGAMAEYKTDNPSRPFCSERCKLLDLGAWAEERYSIPGAAVSVDSNELLSDGGIDEAAHGHPPPAAAKRRLNS